VAPGHPTRVRLGAWVESARVQRIIVAVIVANAITLGLETSPRVMGEVGPLLHALDTTFLTIFVVEIGAKLYARGWSFWRDPWNVFDFLVVAIALVPAAGPFSVLRALRVLRVLRLVSVIPRMRFIVEALLAALPGIASIGALLSLIFYIFAVMATSLFGGTHPDWFGSVGDSLFTLFQIMTLESWSMGIVRPVMEVHPWAWAFFVAFILASSFTMLNLFIAVIVDTMQSLHDEETRREEVRRAAEQAAAALDATPAEASAALLAELHEVRERLDRITVTLDRDGERRPR
jgi:voltage-gated sodium channel